MRGVTIKGRDPCRPEPGFYLWRMIPKAWAVPCRIIKQDGQYSCIIDGEEQPGSWDSDGLSDLMASWIQAETTPMIVKLILFGTPCSESEYNHKLSYKAWARIYSPRHPCLHPQSPVNLHTLAADEF